MVPTQALDMPLQFGIRTNTWVACVIPVTVDLTALKWNAHLERMSCLDMVKPKDVTAEAEVCATAKLATANASRDTTALPVVLKQRCSKLDA